MRNNPCHARHRTAKPRSRTSRKLLTTILTGGRRPLFRLRRFTRGVCRGNENRALSLRMSVLGQATRKSD